MNYLNKLVNSLNKKPLSIIQFNDILKTSDTFFDNLELEKELLISELDGHPNKEGNELIGNIFYERYKDVYTLA